MTDLICKYCHATEHTATSFAHHVCDKDVLRDRITGQEAHMRMWHTEAMRLAKKYNEDTFYHPADAQGSSPSAVSAPALPVPSAEVQELAARAIARQRTKRWLAQPEKEALAVLAAWALAELAARESPDA